MSIYTALCYFGGSDFNIFRQPSHLMALFCNLCKTYKTLMFPSYSAVKFIHKNVRNNTVVLEVDALDDFTSQLVQRQSSKWENLQAKSKQLAEKRTSVSKATVINKSVDEPLKVWTDAVEQKDVKRMTGLIDDCVGNNRAIPKSVLVSIAQILAENGRSKSIIQIKHLCDEYYPELSRLHADFDPYIAEAFWNQGDVEKSLALFEHVYATAITFRHQIKLALKYLFLNIIAVHSEAVLFNVIKFCERIHAEHQDIFLLAVVWQMCFLSEWFADQSSAFDLIETNTELRKVVLLRVPFVVSVALNNHQTDVVYRLLEFLLRHELKSDYSRVLECLFDYKSECGILLKVWSNCCVNCFSSSGGREGLL